MSAVLRSQSLYDSCALILAHTRGAVMSSQPFKDPFNFLYFIGFILVLLLPTLPASLSWLKHLGLI